MEIDESDDLLSTEADKVRVLRMLVSSTLKKVKIEEQKKINYETMHGCDKDNFKRIFKIYNSYQRLKDKEALKPPIYTTLYILWSRITENEKKEFKNSAKKCQNFTNVNETFEALDLICKWVKLNSLIENDNLPFLLYTLDHKRNDELDEPDLKLLPKINLKIAAINKMLADDPQNIRLLAVLSDLIDLFKKLKYDPKKKYLSIIAIMYGPNYYRNIYSAIIMFWTYIQTHVPGIENHPLYGYVVMNMDVLLKTDSHDKLMNKISRTTLTGIKEYIPKRLENVGKLKNANMFQIVKP